MDGPAWRRDRYQDRRPALLARAAILAGLRALFAARGFVEVDMPILQVSPGNETHLHAFRTEYVAPDLTRSSLYLHTSPEFAAKKLLAAGEARFFTLARVFRNREWTPLHHPEFTMLEWYRAGEGYESLMEDCAAILARAAEASGRSVWSRDGASCDVLREPERLTLAEAFARHAGIDLMATLGPDGEGDRDALARAAVSAGVTAAPDDRWTDLFSKLLSFRIEPKLGRERPTILCEYPIGEAALARAKASDPRVAERFELYVCGVELANAFAELDDPVEQRRRFEADMDEKERLYGERYPIDEDFLEALAAMPPAAGSALGLDRLVMLATGVPHIEDQLWLPVRTSR
jgi:lysyl-tRNA synthetase class 2